MKVMEPNPGEVRPVGALSSLKSSLKENLRKAFDGADLVLPLLEVVRDGPYSSSVLQVPSCSPVTVWVCQGGWFYPQN